MLCGNHLNLSSNFFKAERSNSIKQSLAQFLLCYRTTPNSTTSQTPAELLLNRRLKTSLDLIYSDLTGKVFDKRRNRNPEWIKIAKNES